MEIQRVAKRASEVQITWITAGQDAKAFREEARKGQGLHTGTAPAPRSATHTHPKP